MDGLKSLGIATIGQRLSILKAIYLVKLAQNISFNEDDYVPPCSSNIYPISSLTKNEGSFSRSARASRRHLHRKTTLSHQRPR